MKRDNPSVSNLKRFKRFVVNGQSGSILKFDDQSNFKKCKIGFLAWKRRKRFLCVEQEVWGGKEWREAHAHTHAHSSQHKKGNCKPGNPVLVRRARGRRRWCVAGCSLRRGASLVLSRVVVLVSGEKLDTRGRVRMSGKFQGTTTKCKVCNKTVYHLEQMLIGEDALHKRCFQCDTCGRKLELNDFGIVENRIYCGRHAKEAANLAPGETRKTLSRPSSARSAKTPRSAKSEPAGHDDDASGTLKERLELYKQQQKEGGIAAVRKKRKQQAAMEEAAAASEMEPEFMNEDVVEDDHPFFVNEADAQGLEEEVEEEEAEEEFVHPQRRPRRESIGTASTRRSQRSGKDSPHRTKKRIIKTIEVEEVIDDDDDEDLDMNGAASYLSEELERLSRRGSRRSIRIDEDAEKLEHEYETLKPVPAKRERRERKLNNLVKHKRQKEKTGRDQSDNHHDDEFVHDEVAEEAPRSRRNGAGRKPSASTSAATRAVVTTKPRRKSIGGGTSSGTGRAAQLEDQLRRVRELLQMKEEEAEELQARYSESVRQIEDSKESAAHLQSEIEDLNMQLDEQEKLFDAVKADHAKQLEMLRVDKTEAERERDALNRDCKTLQKSFEALRSKNEEMDGLIRDLSTRFEESDDRIDSLMRENAQLKKQQRNSPRPIAARSATPKPSIRAHFEPDDSSDENEEEESVEEVEVVEKPRPQQQLRARRPSFASRASISSRDNRPAPVEITRKAKESDESESDEEKDPEPRQTPTPKSTKLQQPKQQPKQQQKQQQQKQQQQQPQARVNRANSASSKASAKSPNQTLQRKGSAPSPGGSKPHPQVQTHVQPQRKNSVPSSARSRRGSSRKVISDSSSSNDSSDESSSEEVERCEICTKPVGNCVHTRGKKPRKKKKKKRKGKEPSNVQAIIFMIVFILLVLWLTV